MECVNGEWTACSASSPGEVPHSAGDGIVWQHSDGTVHFWSIKNGQRQDGMNIGATGPVGSEWKLIGAGDLNGDGTDDLLWQHSDGTVHYWPIKNGQRLGGMNIGAGPVGPEWKLIGAGDLNGDGTDDLLWQHSDGTVHYWPIKNGQRQGGMNIGATGPVGPEWRLIGAGDLNGDGTDDLLWQHSDGTVHYWLIKNGQRQGGMNIGATGPVGPEWRLIGAGHLKSGGALSIEFEQPGSAPLPPKTSRTIKKIGADGSIIGVTRDPLVGVPEKMWEPGQTLRVRMTGGSAMVRSKVRQFAQEWTKYANLRFQFVDDASPAEIRISFQKGRGTWSSVGRDALGVPFDGPTMNFSDLSDDSTDDDYGYYVLHEFGHALGLIHEHQSPAAGIAWDKEKVYTFYKESQDPPWDKDKVDRNIFDRLSAASTNFSAYDRTSIMHYAYGSDLLLSGTGVTPNRTLSDNDKRYISQWYPHPGADVGQLRTGDDCDQIDFEVQHGVEPADEIAFSLQPGVNVAAWKLMEIPIGGSDYSGLQINESPSDPRVPCCRSILANAIDQARPIRFNKAKALGIHTLLGYRWDVLSAVPGGSRVSLKWVKDRC